MRSLVAFCLGMRWPMVVAAALVLAVGFFTLRSAKVDAFPEFAPPLVEVQTEAPGLSALEVEELVSQPLEHALDGTPRTTTMRSKSVLGLSSVVLYFQEGTDLFQARQLVQERVARAAARLPAAARPPVMLSPLSATSRVMKIGVTSKSKSQMEMSDVVRWNVRPALLAVPGVANVAIWGERDRQLQIRIDPERVRAAGIDIDEIQNAVTAAIRPSAGGFVDTPNQRMAVVHLPTAAAAGPLRELVIRSRAGTVIRLGDVATVEEDFPPPIGDAVINGKPGLLLIVEKQPWGNTLDVTKRVEAVLASIGPSAPELDFDPSIFRPATFVERSLSNLGEALGIGCVLVVVVLGLFLYDWRTAAISVLAIPLSLVMGALVIERMGATMNTMVLAGLAIALGEVVDDAIIDVENILRRLRENAARDSPRPAFDVVLDASLEVRSAVVYASLVVILVFVPIFFLDGLAGSFFRPLALAYVAAVGASLLVALTLTPALSLLLLARRSHADRSSPVALALGRLFAPILERSLDRPRTALAIVAAALASAGAATPFLGEAFLPKFKETDFLMHWVAKPGTSIEAVRRTTERVSRELLAVPGVRHFGSHIGRAEVADEVVGPNFAELWISLDATASYDAATKQIQSIVDGYPGMTRDVQTYLQERAKEVLTGTSGAIVVRLYGPDLDALRDRGGAVQKAISTVSGVVNLKLEPQVLVPQIEVRPRTATMASLGMSPGALQKQTSLLLQGARVGELYRDGAVLDVVLIGEQSFRVDPTTLAAMPLWTPAGTTVSLRDLAEVAIVPAPNVVQREAASRRIDVTCDAAGRDLGSVARDVAKAAAAVPLPSGHHIEILGEWHARAQASRRLGALAVLALLGIGVVLYADFRRARTAAIVFGTLPFALVGGVLAVATTGGVVSLGSVVGLVTVLGIAARNGIMLVSHYRHLEEQEALPFGRDLVARGTKERLAPVLMTALATGLALVPLALRGDVPGYEIEHPMSIVILGGLVSSTAMNLVLLPSLYLRWGRPPPAESE